MVDTKGMVQILKVIVGSQAHGLATPESDYDFRGVFAVPTSQILKLGGYTKNTSWIEGKDDDTSWEIGHFLHLATKCNPTILETFLAPQTTPRTELGFELQSLFPHVWNSQQVVDAFIGYGLNQRKKFFDNKDQRAAKYAVAYLRTLYNAWELLSTGTFTIRIADVPELGAKLAEWKKAGAEAMLDPKRQGEVIELTAIWEKKVREAYEKNPDKQTNLEPINEFLLKVRREIW